MLRTLPPPLLFSSSTARENLARKSEETLGVVRLLASQHHGMAGVSALANRWVEFDTSEEWHVELLGRALTTAGGKNIDLVITVRADEVTHVLGDAKDLNPHLLEHVEGLARILQGNVRGRGDNDGSGQRHRLGKRNHNVAGTGRQIDDEIDRVRPRPPAPGIA